MDKVVDMGAKMVAEMEVDIVADTEVDMDMVADMEVDKVADMPEWLNMARKKVPQSARLGAGGGRGSRRYLGNAQMEGASKI